MPKQEFKGVDGFFKSVKEMPNVIKSTSQELKSTSDSKNYHSWTHHISPTGLINIFEWLGKEENEALIRGRIAQSINQATLLTYQETGLYLTIEIILRNDVIHVFFSTKSNLANFSDDKRLKEPDLTEEEIKLGYRRMKQIEEGNSKKVQYCLHWQPGMPKPYAYAVSILTGKNALAEATKEEKLSKKIGEFYANPSMAGDLRIKNKRWIINLYSPLALGSQFNWVHGEAIIPMFKINPLHFFFGLFKQASSLAWLHHLGIVWRDLKEENYLVFLNSEGEFQLKMTDFSSAELVNGDEKLLKNYIGAPAYFSPEHDFFCDLRKAKINELLKYNKYLSLKKSISSFKPEAESESQFSALNDAYIRVKQEFQYCREKVLICQASIRKQLPQACPDSIEIIINCTDFKKLLSPEKDKIAFLAHPKDDVWNFSALMVNIITKYLQKNSSSPHHKFLKIVQQYFQGNLKLFRASRPTGNQIVDEFLQLFKIAYPSKEHEIHTWIAKFQKEEQDFKISRKSSTQSVLTSKLSPGVFPTIEKIPPKVTSSHEKENIPQAFNT